MIINERFAKYLETNSSISPEMINKYLDISDKNETPIYFEIIKEPKVSEEEVYRLLATFFKTEYRYVQLSELNFPLIDKFPRAKLIEFKTVPIEENEDSVSFILSNPLRFEDLQEFKAITPKQIRCYVSTTSNINDLVSYIDNKAQQRSVMEGLDSDSNFKDSENNGNKTVEIDAPVIKLCDSILKDAISRKASDIHIEPFQEDLLLRFRIDGKLSVVDHLNLNMYQAILARYKIMAEMNIAERRVPQDGKINMSISGVEFDFRVSTIPTINGEKIVIRIFNNSLSTANINSLGYNENEQKLVLNMISRPHGIILLTGPTGSGKSTSLYTFLRHLNKEDTNIITVEDPVENVIDGINQVQVNPKANMTFANALRSILRQDPNIIMIGEIRDEETAAIATRAAITGHLVLSTLHTNSATGVVSRLVNMGVAPYLVADSLLGAISQRLVRRLCPKCKKEHLTTKAEMEILGLDKPTKICSPVGCPACNNTGYSGRTGVFEIMVCDDSVRSAIMNDHFSTELLNNVVEGKMVSLIDNCKEKILQGITSIEEYNELSEVVKTK